MVIKLEDDDHMSFLNGQREHDDELIDPIYKIFLEHLREDGKSYVFEMINGDHGSPAVVKYEGEDELSEKSELDTHTSSGNISSDGRGHCVTKRRWARRRSCSKSDEVVDLSCVPSIHSEFPVIEESYLTFLSHLKFKDSSMILEYDSVSVTYEKEREKSISSSLATESTVYSDEQGLIPYKSTQPSDLTVYEDANSSMVSLDCCDLSEFKMKLMVILNKPYDQNEYEELLKEATDRKPLNRQKHLRSMSISYATKEVGLSYLDHFPDLAKQIWSGDSHQRLILLRGFFFWLKNLCHEGAFMPWVLSGYEAIEAGDYELVLPLEIARDEN